MDSPTGPSGERRLAGRYRLESVLGRGGMGVVWAAQDELLHRPVAIKEVLAAPGLSEEQVALMRRRTLQEARAAARLSSPAAVLVYDVVDQDGEPWVVMERLAARTLADVLDERGPLPPDEVATLGLRLLDALDAAHAVGVMHRDVKPANVMFRGDADMANAVLTDFGIARFDGDPATTATGTLIGSPAFVAPERARGDQARPASDLWALGITLWIAAEGVSPFHREGTLQTLTAVLTAEPPPIRRAGPLAPALVGLLAKDPSERLDSRRLRALLRPMAGRAAAAATQTMPVPVREPQPEPVPRAEPVRQPVPVPEPVPGPVGAGQKGPPGAGLETSPQHGDTGPPRGSDGSDRGLSPAGRRRVGLLAGLLAVVLVAGGAAALLATRDGAPSTAGGASSRGASSTAPTSAAASASAGTSDTTSVPTSATASRSAGSSSGATSSGPATASRSRSATSSGSSSAASSAGSSAASSGSSSGSEPESGSGAAPAGMRRYSDPTGFSVAVPAGWRVDRRGGRVYVRDPASSAFLLVDQTTDPADDPVADWRAQERAVSRRLSNYRRIRIDPVTVRQWRGADWEFTHGRATHVLNRNLVTGPNRAYALYWSAPDASWQRSLPEFQRVSASFEPRQ